MIKVLIASLLLNCLWVLAVLSQSVNSQQNEPIDNIQLTNVPLYQAPSTFKYRLSENFGISMNGLGSAYSAGLRYYLKDNNALCYNLMYITGFNSLFQSDNYAFTTNIRIIDQSLVYEYYFIGKLDHSSAGSIFPDMSDNSSKFNLYGFMGVGGQVLMPGSLTSSLNFRSITSKGSQSNVYIPLGIGMNYKFDNNMTIGLEIHGRFNISSGYNGYYGDHDLYYNGISNSSYRIGNNPLGYPEYLGGSYKHGPGF
jgi:opacity protein-like surface antigen